MKLTPEYLSELERLCGEAFKSHRLLGNGEWLSYQGKMKKQDYDFLMASHAAMPLLIARIRELETELSNNI